MVFNFNKFIILLTLGTRTKRKFDDVFNLRLRFQYNTGRASIVADAKQLQRKFVLT